MTGKIKATVPTVRASSVACPYNAPKKLPAYRIIFEDNFHTIQKIWKFVEKVENYGKCGDPYFEIMENMENLKLWKIIF